MKTVREAAKSAAWQRKEGKSPSGGLNRKGIASYRRANPGSKLKMAVTTKPSKLKPGSKSANRRKSFCARMGGMKKRLTSAKTARDPNSRINKAYVNGIVSMKEIEQDIKVIRESQIRMEQDIKYHIKRTDLLEERVQKNEDLLKPMIALQWLKENLRFILLLLGCIAAIITWGMKHG